MDSRVCGGSTTGPAIGRHAHRVRTHGGDPSPNRTTLARHIMNPARSAGILDFEFVGPLQCTGYRKIRSTILKESHDE